MIHEPPATSLDLFSLGDPPLITKRSDLRGFEDQLNSVTEGNIK